MRVRTVSLWAVLSVVLGTVVVAQSPQLINRQRVLDAVNGVPTTPLPPKESCDADGTPNAVDEDQDGAVDETCRWTAAAAVAWLTVTPGAGAGSSAISYTVVSNSSASGRSGALTIADQSFAVNQAGAAPPQPPGSARYPLELVNIKPVGGHPNGLDSTNRIFRAYPGLDYNIRAAVTGGAFPYTFTLTNAPQGMTVSADGTIAWPNPQANASPTLTVRDRAGTQVSSTWPITVSPNGFRFVDAVAGRNAANNGCAANCGTGTQTNPWRTIKDAFHNTPNREIVYYRTGVYSILDIPSVGVGGDWQHVEFNGTQRSDMWLEYPGDAAVIDFGYQAGSQWGPFIRLAGVNSYIDGFETTRSHIMAFQVAPVSGQRAVTFRRNVMRNHGPGQDGSNAAFIMTMSNYPSVAYGLVIQDNQFINAATCTLKLYSQEKTVIENNLHEKVAAGPELKSDVRRFTVRGDTYLNVAGTAIGGNMHNSAGGVTNGEILFNHVQATVAIRLNQDGLAGPIFVDRNTFRGFLEVDNVGSSNGPFAFTTNVIVNTHRTSAPRPFFDYFSVTAPQRITSTNDLTGLPSAGLLDANGLLQGSFRAQHGPASANPKGHER